MALSKPPRWSAVTRCWPVPPWTPLRSGSLNRPRKKAVESWSSSSSIRINRNLAAAKPQCAQESGRNRKMTIGKKLYVNFGAVLAMVVVLFLVTYVAVQREHSAKASASQALELADATD